jgi:predicted transcriptional regulator
MITLQKKQIVKVHQVAMELLTKTKESPFIAILILAKELGGSINPEILRSELFPNLPLAACRNLLVRLELQGYFKQQEDKEGGIYVTEMGKRDNIVETYIRNFEQPIIATELNRFNRQITIEQFQDWINRNLQSGLFQNVQPSQEGFWLTQKGQESAADKSMWVGEKGIYNVYSTETPFSEQRIIGIEPVKNKTIDDRDQKPQRVSNELSSYENQEIYLKGTEYRIEKIEDKCFQLQDENWGLKLSAVPKQKANLSIKGKDITEFSQEMTFDFEALQSDILTEEFALSYKDGYVLSAFDTQNTNFVREIKIEKPVWRSEVFEPTNLKNIKHRPATEQDAQNWYLHLLTNNIQKYFLSDSEFDNHSNAHTQLFQPHFNLTAKKRTELIKELSLNKGTFYQRVKLETINYLNF